MSPHQSSSSIWYRDITKYPSIYLPFPPPRYVFGTNPESSYVRLFAQHNENDHSLTGSKVELSEPVPTFKRLSRSAGKATGAVFVATPEVLSAEYLGSGISSNNGDRPLFPPTSTILTHQTERVFGNRPGVGKSLYSVQADYARCRGRGIVNAYATHSVPIDHLSRSSENDRMSLAIYNPPPSSDLKPNGLLTSRLLSHPKHPSTNFHPEPISVRSRLNKARASSGEEQADEAQDQGVNNPGKVEEALPGESFLLSNRLSRSAFAVRTPMSESDHPKSIETSSMSINDWLSDDRSSGVTGELWIDTLSLRDWLEEYLNKQRH